MEKTKEIIEKIREYTLEDIMGERFGSYSKYIIQERAIPDARDGLKPVQRRILYSMYKEKNTYDRPYRKSAKTVGDVIGNYHPHGDSSIYEAMVRMSQEWKSRYPYIDMHGNNGSIDGDSPAAYRYTEARLSKISNEMLRDINRNTVEFAPNFDDSLKEPTVLPARFPALLVYGTQGISAGYATNIPPHNLGEVIDAAIYLIDNSEATLDELMNFVKGPDFPTGAIIEGKKGLLDAYQTGKGKIIIKSKYEFEEKNGKTSLVITEIPYEVNKALLVKKIDDIRLDKKIDGIVEVRDESAQDIRIVIDLKKGVNKEFLVNFLLKNTDMQISYNFNMVAIVKKRPKLLGLKNALKAFIDHQQEVVRRRSEFDLAHAKKELHILDGLKKCLSILDEVIKTIRASKNKSDAKENLVKEYAFSYEQAEAIVTLQLYRLTNTDVVELEERCAVLEKIIASLTAILENEKILKKVMKEELKKVKSEYNKERITEVRDEVTEIKLDTTALIPKEDTIVTISREGYIKRTSIRSYSASDIKEPLLKENDYLLGEFKMKTTDTLLVFTSFGNYLYIPVHTINDLKWRELGKHVSNLVPLQEDEEIVTAIPVSDFNDKKNIILATSQGMIKSTSLADFKLTRYSKATSCMKLKDNDKLIAAFYDIKDEIFIETSKGYGLWFSKDEIPVVGIKAGGVKAITLKDDSVTSILNFNESDNKYLAIVTDKGTGKRMHLKDFDKTTRARRGLLTIRDVKTNPYHVVAAFFLSPKEEIGLKNGEITYYKGSDLTIADRYSTGSTLRKGGVDTAFKVVELNDTNNQEEEIEVLEVEKPDLEKLDARLMTIDDFLNDNN
ncbi:MAG: DNA topoisomerase IV subunit A [Clostridium sp.]|nr:DNA topoisomerase IV subunit A [Clostridium sp.]